MTDPAGDSPDDRRWKEVRVKRRRRTRDKTPLQAWLGKRRRKFRTWLIISLMVAGGFACFLMLRGYLDRAAAAEAEAEAPR
jgi:hypothetical protein